ncbi:NAD-dependent epimerase/dehydratase family protein [Pedobacter suwonensis]|uniref:NAD-dependent epimerase/dehydratase family protein n=1 Tax=Pedobacter suwonensis TaxID=332999 RepID=UPI0011A70CE9|nr:NAD-dependent epimerase/dehydratase family protein [Pedobacter suwonensis]
MNVLIIGGNGFIGSHLVDHFLEKKYKVRVFDVSYEKFRAPLAEVDYRISKLDNIPDLYEAMLGIDIVFHLASASVPSTSNVDQIADINNNLIPTLNILNLMNRLGIKKIVYFSSGGAVYGNADQAKITEDVPLNPISSYGIVKSTIEHYIYLYNRLYNLNYLIIRPSNPYGPRQGHFIAQGVISTFLRKVLDGESLSVFGDGSATKDYIYIKDFVSILFKLVERNGEGVFNIGSGEGTSINSIIEEVNLATGLTTSVNYTPQKSYDVSNFVLDISKVTSVVGDIEITPVRTGIEETWKWIKTLKNK